MTKDYVLMQIANSIAANVQKMKGPGLLDGQMGAVVFLYHYARYSDHSVYSDLADLMLDEISYIQLAQYKQLSFSNGLSGIGWSINHLSKEQFLNVDDALMNFFDDSLVRGIKASIDEDMLDSGIYLASCRQGLLDVALVSVLNKQVSEFLHSTCHPLSVLNKILAIAIRLTHQHHLQWCDTLPDTALNTIENEFYRRSDVLICKELIEVYHRKDDNKSWDILLDRCKSILSESDLQIEDCLETVWQYLVFLDSAHKEKLDIDRIAVNVSEILKDINEEDLYLSSGLPAMGLGLLLSP